jgi:hypothetical protein
VIACYIISYCFIPFLKERRKNSLQNKDIEKFPEYILHARVVFKLIFSFKDKCYWKADFPAPHHPPVCAKDCSW